ncbi:AsnC family transcriptional regulator [Rhodococcoides trifolii]|uniref:AsnC family transcriptional regulator n=1 Tax=Rhodococcoides trifolii TaxID=908250 RepID=A0A917D272_9NOCA|nr:Lrp/AsnC ligand binding domain-containing protein [Rhodococcus trifolii]GGG06447.1 AsnC family transcriptional regulator [Rhodococcus trifolii]
MVQAYILIQTEVGRASLVAQQISALDGVVSAEDVIGPYDVVVRCSGDSDAALADAVAAIQKVDGITRTLTCQLAGTPVRP